MSRLQQPRALLGQSSGLANEPVQLNVNQTQYACVTNGSGYFSLSLSLKAADDNATTYTVTASFEDNSTAPVNATAWATTLDGKQYPACTTIQYGYKPQPAQLGIRSEERCRS
jgi:hypothetical protein